MVRELNEAASRTASHSMTPAASGLRATCSFWPPPDPNEIWLRAMSIEPIEATAAVTDDDLQLRVALEHVAVAEELGGQVLLGVEAELVVVRDDSEAAIKGVRAMDDEHWRSCPE